MSRVNVPLATAVAAAAVLAAVGAGAAPPRGTLGDLRPDAVVDLRTAAGAALVKGEWRYHDAAVVEVEHRSPGPDLKPSGPPNRTHDISPRAGVADFDDSSWEVITPEALEARRGTGKLCFGWYRIRVTVPERIGSLHTAGATAVLEIVVDDYAEVWVDGRLPTVPGQAGEHLAGGWNAPNRLVAAREVRPGQEIQLAIFAMNAPLSSPPANYLWIRSANLDFYRRERASPAVPVAGELVRLDPAVDAIVPRTGAGGVVAETTPGGEVALAPVTIEKLADGFQFTEGPLWVPDGYLLFSDPNANRIYRWTPDGQVSTFRSKSGYSGFDIGEYGQPGSNGLALDRDGRLTICEHGNRRVTRLEKNGVLTVLADRFEGRRLNSPNDLVYRSDGALFFTDPPFGLPRYHDDPRKELPWSGVYCLQDGKLTLVTKELSGPNGIAFSPDEKYLYVGNWDLGRKVVMRYEVRADGSVAAAKVHLDLTSASGEEAIDGLEVDGRGNLFVSGPGGIWIVAADGRRLGILRTPELPANFAWGDADGKTLYLTARNGLYRLRLNFEGAAWAHAVASGGAAPGG